MQKNLLLVVRMTATGKKIRDKYCSMVERVAARKFLLSDHGDERYILDDMAQSLIAQAIEEYERAHEVPRVDFWGQSIE